MKSLTLTTAPANEPVTLAEAKNWLRLDGSDDDGQIAGLITAARTSAEEYTRRSFVTQTWKLTLDQACGTDFLGEGVYDLPVSALYAGLPTTIPLPKGPVQSVTSVTTYALDNTATAYPSSNYRADAAGDRLVLNSGSIWPSNLRPQAACEILYATGYGDNPTNIPQPVKTAILIHLAALYEQRGKCDDAADLPPGTKQLLNQYRVMGRRG